MNGYSVSPEFAWWLFQHIRLKQPKLVIDLGSGLSTVVIASALEQNGCGRLLAFEHEQGYLDKTAGLLGAQGLTDRVDLLYAPLRSYRLGEGVFRWYDLPWHILDTICREDGAQLVLVDGPPKAAGALARYPAHPLLKKYYASAACILLDDASRKDEKRILARWREEDPGLERMESLSDFRHQPVLIYWIGPNELERPEPILNQNLLATAVENAITMVVASPGVADRDLATAIHDLVHALQAQVESRLNTIKSELAIAPEEASELYQQLREARGQPIRGAREEQIKQSENDQLRNDFRQELAVAHQQVFMQVTESERLRGQIEKLMAQLREVDAVSRARQEEVAKLREALSRANRVIEQQERKIDRMSNTLSMQLGPVIGRNLGSPIGWARLPFELLSTYKRIRIKSKSSLAQAGIGSLAKNHKHFMWQAWQIANDLDIDKAIQYAETHCRNHDRSCIDILRANKYSDSDTQWLEHVNRYLTHFGTSGIRLIEGGLDRFQRFAPTRIITVNEGPMISVIMPAFNAEWTIRQAAQSILQQSWRTLELIIVDDASTDHTLQVAKETAASDKRVRVLENAWNVGPYVSKNRAVQCAAGAYITGQDADDWAHPDRLKNQLNAMLVDNMKRPVCLNYMIRMSQSGLFTTFSKVGPTSPDGVARVALVSCMFAADFLRDRLGFWDSVRFGADSEMLARAEVAASAPIPRLRQIGMLCLDLETSLTNHPEHGICKMDGLSATRRIYREAWGQWHKTLDGTKTLLPYPHDPRLFDAPDAAVVPASMLSGTNEI